MASHPSIEPWAEVLAAMHARRLLHVPAGEGGNAGLRFGWGELEALLARDAINAADYRFFKGGKQIAPAAMGLLDGRGALRQQAVSRLIAQGITIIGNRLEYKLPEFWPLMCAVRSATGGDVCLGFVASFECPKALPIHYDYSDNIVLQTEGSKRWELYGEPVAGSGCQRTLERVPDAPIRSVELVRGDLLFVPSGLHHQCNSDADSLHLSVLVSWPTGLQMLERVTRLAAEDEVVCEALRRFADDASLRSSEQGIKERLHALIDGIDARALLDELADRGAREDRLPLPRREHVRRGE